MFDIVLMNPPYDRSLHLKFLEKTIKIANNVVSIQPVRWIKDPNAKYSNKSALNKYENSIAKHIYNLDLISDKESEELFNAAFTMDLGIYTCTKEGGYNYKLLSEDKIFDNVVKSMKDNVSNHIEYSIPKKSIIISLITGGNKGRKSNLIDLYDTFSDNYKKYIFDDEGKRLDNGLTFYQNREKTAWGNVKPKEQQNNIKFDTIEECINFYKFTKLDLFRYMFNKSVVDVHVHPEKLPFINDYTKEWTNEQLYNYFNISKDGRIYISDYIKNEYKLLKERIDKENANKKSKRNNWLEEHKKKK